MTIFLPLSPPLSGRDGSSLVTFCTIGWRKWTRSVDYCVRKIRRQSQLSNSKLKSEAQIHSNLSLIPDCAIRRSWQEFLIVGRPAQIIDDAKMPRQTGAHLIQRDLTWENINIVIYNYWEHWQRRFRTKFTANISTLLSANSASKFLLRIQKELSIESNFETKAILVRSGFARELTQWPQRRQRELHKSAHLINKSIVTAHSAPAWAAETTTWND